MQYFLTKTYISSIFMFSIHLVKNFNEPFKLFFMWIKNYWIYRNCQYLMFTFFSLYFHLCFSFSRVAHLNLTGYDWARQTLLAQKFWPPNFFMKSCLPYDKKLGSVKKCHPWPPWGTQGGHIGVRPPKREKSSF